VKNASGAAEPIEDCPLARTEELVVQELGDETLVYDLQRDQAHCLNPTSAAVWRRCDGHATSSQIRARLQEELGTAVDPRVVELALDQLGRARLLAIAAPRSERVSRRELGRDLGKVLAFSLPVVLTVAAPAMATLASNTRLCINRLGPCVPGEECYRCGNGCDKFCDPHTLNCVSDRPADCPVIMAPSRSRMRQRPAAARTRHRQPPPPQ